MLTLLISQIHKAEIIDRAGVYFLAAGELVVFDVPVIMVLYLMWKGL